MQHTGRGGAGRGGNRGGGGSAAEADKRALVSVPSVLEPKLRLGLSSRYLPRGEGRTQRGHREPWGIANEELRGTHAGVRRPASYPRQRTSARLHLLDEFRALDCAAVVGVDRVE